MAHKLERFISNKINNVPALIQESELRNIVEYLETRDSPSLGIKNDQSKLKETVFTDNLAVIPISGSLTYEPTFLGALCGMSSYQSILGDVEKAIKAGIKTIVFDANSGGGEAYAMMDTARRIRSRVDDVGGKIITYIDGTCASACYGLSVISDEIIAHPDARTGSVGVVVRLVNDKEYQKKSGLQTSYITSTKSKVPFNDEGDFREDFLKDIQEQVNNLHTKFANHVAEFRNMSLEDVNKTEAKVFDSDKAKEINFIDKIMSHDEFFSYLEETTNEGQQLMPLGIKTNSKDKNLQNQQEEKSMSEKEIESLKAELESLKSSNMELKETLEAKENDFTSISEQLKTTEQTLEELKQEQAQAKLDKRKEMLSEVLPSDKLDSVFSAISGLDDTGFNAIYDSYKAQSEQEQKQEEFNEIGVDGEAESGSDLNSGVMKLIKNGK